jgi:hypothetical protein
MIKIDIIAIEPTKPINNVYTVVSALPTGSYNKLLVTKNYSANLTISNIQSKFAERFDDPSYYYGSCGVDGGDIN